MFFRYLPGPAGTLQVEQAGFQSMPGYFPIAFHLLIKAGPQNPVKEFIQCFTIPPTVHVRFA